MRLTGVLAALAGLAIMAFAYFSSSYDHRDEITVLGMRIEQQRKALENHEPMPRDEVPADVFNPELAQRRQFGFMGGGALLVVGAILFAAGRRRDDEATAPATPPSSPPAA